ncbi:MAG: orotidine-5'-phosphate decarboxylase, partial [Mycoplasmataceae bacterium]|nr:orotidine-5'-phosphate decarboxylase [Mycoplasmataceae bacterium]
MQSNVIIACDFSQEKQLFDFLKKFKNEKLFLKIGYELFFKFGESVVLKIKQMNHRIFLDLKLLDIPNTVEHGVSNLMKFQPDLLSIHASGGIEMMKAALRGVGKHKTQLVAVTQLTSLSPTVLKKELLINKDLSGVVQHYASNAHTAKI